MYPSNLQTNLKRPEGAYGQTSLARTFVTTVRLGLARSRVQPFPRKKIELRAPGFELRANRCFGLLAARGPKLQACILEPRDVSVVTRACSSVGLSAPLIKVRSGV